MSESCYQTITSSVGELVVGAHEDGCLLIEYVNRGGLTKILKKSEERYQQSATQGKHGAIVCATEQLTEYFLGKRQVFDFELDLKGPAFEVSVWEALPAIPFGDIASHGEIAKRVGKSGAAHAVGRANGENPLTIVVPYHRVVQMGGGLRGYGGGLWRKQKLLELESAGPQWELPLPETCRSVEI